MDPSNGNGRGSPQVANAEPSVSPRERTGATAEGEDVNRLLREQLVDYEERLRAVNRAWTQLDRDIQLLVYTADAPIIHPPPQSDAGKDPFLEALLRALPKDAQPADAGNAEALVVGRSRETLEALSALMDHLRGEEERNSRLSQALRRAASAPEALATENARLQAALAAARAEGRRAEAARRTAEARAAELEDMLAVQRRRLEELGRVAARASSRPISHPYHHSPPNPSLHPRAADAMDRLRQSSWDGGEHSLRHQLSRQITPPRGFKAQNKSFDSAAMAPPPREVHRLSSIPRGMTIDEALGGTGGQDPQDSGREDGERKAPLAGGAPVGRTLSASSGPGAAAPVAAKGTFAAALFGQIGGGARGGGGAGAREPPPVNIVTAARQQRREAMQAASAALSGMPDVYAPEETAGGEQGAAPGAVRGGGRRVSGTDLAPNIHGYNRRVSGDLAPRMAEADRAHRGRPLDSDRDRDRDPSPPHEPALSGRAGGSERSGSPDPLPRSAHQEAASVLGPALLRLTSRASAASSQSEDEPAAAGAGGGALGGSTEWRARLRMSSLGDGSSLRRSSATSLVESEASAPGSRKPPVAAASPGGVHRRGSGASLGGDKKAWAASTSDVVARAVGRFQRRNSGGAHPPSGRKGSSASIDLTDASADPGGGDGTGSGGPSSPAKLTAGGGEDGARRSGGSLVDPGGALDVAPADPVSVEEAILKGQTEEEAPLMRLAVGVGARLANQPSVSLAEVAPDPLGGVGGGGDDDGAKVPTATESFKKVFFSCKHDANPDLEPEGGDVKSSRRRRLVRWLRKMPKVDVNRWLTTAPHPAALMEVAEELESEGGDSDIVEELNVAMLEEYMAESSGDMRPRTLAVVKRLWSDPVHICYLTHEAVAWAAADRVKHCEFRLNPMDMLLSPDKTAAKKLKKRASNRIRYSITPRRLLELVSSALMQASQRYATDTRMVVVLFDVSKPKAEQLITACMELSEMKTTKGADRPGGINRQGSVVGVELRLETDKFGQSCVKLSRRLRVRIGDPWLTTQVARLKSAGLKITALADAHCSGATAQAAVMALGVSRLFQGSLVFSAEEDRETLDTLSDYSVVMEVPFNVQQYREQAPWERAKVALRGIKSKRPQMSRLKSSKNSTRALAMNMDALRTYVQGSKWADHHDAHNMPSGVIDVKTSGVDVALKHRDNGLNVAVGLLHPCTTKATLTDAYAHLVVALERQGATSVVFSHVKRAIITAAEATFTTGSYKNRLVQMMSMCMGALTPRLIQRLIDSRDALDDIVADAVMLEFGDLSEDALAEQGLDPSLLTRGGVPPSVIVAHMLDVDISYAAPDMNLAAYRGTVYRDIVADFPRPRGSITGTFKRSSTLGGSQPGPSLLGGDEGPEVMAPQRTKRAEFLSKSFSAGDRRKFDESMSRASIDTEPGSSRQGGSSSAFWNRLAGSAAVAGAASYEGGGGSEAGSEEAGGSVNPAAPPQPGVDEEAAAAAAAERAALSVQSMLGETISAAEGEDAAEGGEEEGTMYLRSSSSATDLSEIQLSGISAAREGAEGTAGAGGTRAVRRGSAPVPGSLEDVSAPPTPRKKPTRRLSSGIELAELPASEGDVPSGRVPELSYRASRVAQVSELAELKASAPPPGARLGGLRRGSTGTSGNSVSSAEGAGGGYNFGFPDTPNIRKRVKISIAGDSDSAEASDLPAPPLWVVDDDGGVTTPSEGGSRASESLGNLRPSSLEDKEAAFASLQSQRRVSSMSGRGQLIRRQSSRYGSFARALEEDDQESSALVTPSSKEAVRLKLETARQKGRAFLKRCTSVIRPESKGATYFSTFMGFVVVFRALTDPYIFAFVEGVPGPWSGWFVIVTTANLVYVGCMYTSFRLGFSTKDEEGRVRVVLGRREIALHYLSTWFVVDLACVLVYYVALILYPIRSDNGSADWIEALPLLSLLRIGRLRQLEIPVRFKQTNVYVLSALFFWFFMQAHIIGCFWFFMQRQEDFIYDCICAEPNLPDPPGNVVERLLGNGQVEAVRDAGFDASACDPVDSCCGYSCPSGYEPIAECADAGLMQPFLLTVAPYRQYLASLYFGFNSVAAFGPASTPCTGPEILLSCLTVVVGLATFALIIGEIDTIVRSKNRVNIDYREKLEEVRRFVNNHRVPPHLSHRIFSFLEEGWRRNKGVDEEGILGELSFTLRRDMKQYLHKRSVIQVPMFRQCNEAFVDALCLHLRQGWCLEGEILIHQGSVGREMYFLQRGVAEVGDSDFTTLYATLKDGSYFGEVALLSSDMRIGGDDDEDVPASSNFLPGLRTASVRAKTYCEFYTLLKEALWDLLPSYPREHKLIKEAARQKVLQGRSLEHERQRRSNAACTIQNWWRRYTVLLWLDGPNGAPAF